MILHPSIPHTRILPTGSMAEFSYYQIGSYYVTPAVDCFARSTEEHEYRKEKGEEEESRGSVASHLYLSVEESSLLS